MRNPLLIPVATAMLLVAAPTFARERPTTAPAGAEQANRQNRERDARRACLNGDYATGVALLSDLFLDFKDPVYIFNQGRCYQQNQRFDEAIARFREYLRTDTDAKALVEKHIAECEALQQKKSQPGTPPATVPVAPSPPSHPSAAPEPTPTVEARQPLASPSSPRSGMRVAGAVIAAVGVAGLATGIALNLKANSLADSIDPPTHSFDRHTESTRNSYETFSWVGYGVGAVGIATGAILYGIGWSGSRSDGDVALVPTIGLGLVGAMVGGSF
jgi:tetratricopeptide (TPR) repeat protein